MPNYPWPKVGERLIWYWLGAGVAYGIGYAVQEGLSLTPLVSTAPVFTPSPFVQWLYLQFAKRPWKPVEVDEGSFTSFENNATERQFTQFQRIVTLMHIGATLGCNWLLAGILLILRFFVACDPFDLTMGIAAFVFSFVLISMCWIKGAQQVQFVAIHQLAGPSYVNKANEHAKPAAQA